jgi:hypothetical protein
VRAAGIGVTRYQGQLGNGTFGNLSAPYHIRSSMIDGRRFERIGCGGRHSIAATSEFLRTLADL